MADISFSSIHVDTGQELGETAQVSVHAAGRNTTRAGDQLIIFFDLPAASDPALRDAAKVLSTSYWNAPGGVTTALRLAMKVANDKLFEINRGLPTEQKAEGSLTCIVTNTESIVIAQAGPAVAYARNKAGAFEPIVPQDGSNAVGGSRTIDVYFSNFAPQEGDVFVITGAGSCISVQQRLIEMCMAKGEARMVAGYLNANIKQGRLVGVALSVDDVPTFAAPLEEPTNMRPKSTSAKGNVGRGEAINQKPQQTRTAQTDDGEETTNKATLVRDSGARVLSEMGDSLNQAARSVQRSLGEFGGALLPGTESQAITQANENGRAMNFGLLAIAILIPIIAAVLGSSLYLQFSGEIERQQLKKAAIAAVQTAESTQDATALRANWPQALQAIATYEKANPSDAAFFAESKTKAQTQLDQVGKVVRVQPAVLAEVDPGAHRAAASAFGVYVINTSNNSGQYFVATPDRKGIQGKGFLMRPSRTLQNSPVAFADVIWGSTFSSRWRTEGAVVVGKANLAEYSSVSGEIAPLPLPNDAITAVVQAKAGELYNNTVYVLDVGVGQVWRFRLSDRNPGDGLEKTDPYFGNPFPTLQQSVDIAIDGGIYVLQQNGAVLKFFNRKSEPLTMSGYTESFGQPVSLVVTGPDTNNGTFIVADAATGSLIEFSKSGAFMRQFRGAANDFVGLQDMTLDVSTNTIYVVTNNKLMAFKLQ